MNASFQDIVAIINNQDGMTQDDEAMGVTLCNIYDNLQVCVDAGSISPLILLEWILKLPCEESRILNICLNRRP